MKWKESHVELGFLEPWSVDRWPVPLGESPNGDGLPEVADDGDGDDEEFPSKVGGTPVNKVSHLFYFN